MYNSDKKSFPYSMKLISVGKNVLFPVDYVSQLKTRNMNAK